MLASICWMIQRPSSRRLDVQRRIRFDLVTFDPERPGITNLLTIYQMLTGQSQQEIEAEFAGKGYGDFKAALTERLVETLQPIQQRYNELINDMTTLESILKQGADDVRPLAAATLNRVKEVIGLG